METHEHLEPGTLENRNIWKTGTLEHLKSGTMMTNRII